MSLVRESGAAGRSRFRAAMGGGLVVAQIGVSVLLVCAAAVFASHLRNLRHRDVGFERDSILLVSLERPRADAQAGPWVGGYRELVARLETIPSIRSVTLSAITPMSAAAGSRFATVPGVVEPYEARQRLAMNTVAPNYFQTFGTPFRAGRDFRFEDQGGPRVAIVNAATAVYYFGAERDAVGRNVLFEGDSQPYEIVGVVADAKYRDLRERAPRTIYLNAVQDPRNVYRQLSVRTDGAPSAVAEDVRRMVGEVLKTARVAGVTTMAARMDETIVPERLLAVVSAPFGVLGVLLAAAGLYGLMSYTVARRTSEIGVRVAMGATRGDIAAMVFGRAFRLTAAGLLLAVPVVYLSRRLAATAVMNLTAGVAMPWLLASAVLLVVGLLAAYMPARRAAAIEPAVALRCD